MTFFDPLSDPCWPASDTTGDRTSYLASYLAAQKPTKRQPDIYQAVFNYYLAVSETRLLMVHPSLAGRVYLFGLEKAAGGEMGGREERRKGRE